MFSRGRVGASLTIRSEAIVLFALKLTRTANAVSAGDIQALRSTGLSDAAIHDVAVVASYFNFVNRMALGLGVELEAHEESE